MPATPRPRRSRRIAPGLRADLNLIDPARLRTGTPRLVRDLPAGGKRFLQKAEGYVGTGSRTAGAARRPAER
jgi:N-acyl-D-aspartate/D-glutamate deacylase